MASSPSPAQMAEIERALREQQKITAIRLYREATGASLFAARQFLEGHFGALAQTAPIEAAPAPPSIVHPPAPAAPRSGATALYLLAEPAFAASYEALPRSLSAAAWKAMCALAPEEAEEAACPVEGDIVPLTPMAGLVIWECCRQNCGAGWVNSATTDTFFADLEAQPPDWQSLPASAMPAWEAWIALGGVSGPRGQLPWWLEGARRSRGAWVGLANPEAVALMHRHARELSGLFTQSRMAADVDAFLHLLGAGAARGASALVWEPGT